MYVCMYIRMYVCTYTVSVNVCVYMHTSVGAANERGVVVPVLRAVNECNAAHIYMYM